MSILKWLRELQICPRTWPLLLCYCIKEIGQILAIFAFPSKTSSFMWLALIALAVVNPFLGFLALRRLTTLPQTQNGFLYSGFAAWPLIQFLVFLHASPNLLAPVFYLMDLILIALVAASLQREYPSADLMKPLSYLLFLLRLMLFAILWGFKSLAIATSLKVLWFLAVVGIIAAVIAAAIDPLIDFLWIKWRLAASGFSIQTHYCKVSTADFTAEPHLSVERAVICQAAVSIHHKKQSLHGVSFEFNNDSKLRIETLRTLSIAACEAYERLVTLASPAVGRNVNSNGVALHSNLHEARERSALELLERDSVLAHYYTGRPALAKYDLRTLIKEEFTSEQLSSVALIASQMDSAELFRLYSPLPCLASYWLVLTHAGKTASGWAIGRRGDLQLVTKAFSEALSGYRFYNVEPGKGLLARYRNEQLACITHETFFSDADALSISNTDLQCLVLLGSDPEGRHIKFLRNCKTIQALDEFVNFQDAQNWYRAPSIEFDILPQAVPSPFVVVRATSNETFQIDWPKEKEEEIIKIAKQKGIDSELCANIQLPCIVY